MFYLDVCLVSYALFTLQLHVGVYVKCLLLSTVLTQINIAQKH